VFTAGKWAGIEDSSAGLGHPPQLDVTFH